MYKRDGRLCTKSKLEFKKLCYFVKWFTVFIEADHKYQH